jgi:hypothetical protein
MLAAIVVLLLVVLGFFDFALAQTLSDGTSFKTGIINSSVRWQSSGVLQNGSCQ